MGRGHGLRIELEEGQGAEVKAMEMCQCIYWRCKGVTL